MSLKVYNPSTDKFEDPSGGGAQVTVDAGAKDFRWLLVGTVSYLANAREIAKPGMLQFIRHVSQPVPFFRADTVQPSVRWY